MLPPKKEETGLKLNSRRWYSPSTGAYWHNIPGTCKLDFAGHAQLGSLHQNLRLLSTGPALPQPPAKGGGDRVTLGYYTVSSHSGGHRPLGGLAGRTGRRKRPLTLGSLPRETPEWRDAAGLSDRSRSRPARGGATEAIWRRSWSLTGRPPPFLAWGAPTPTCTSSGHIPGTQKKTAATSPPPPASSPRAFPSRPADTRGIGAPSGRTP